MGGGDEWRGDGETQQSTKMHKKVMAEGRGGREGKKFEEEGTPQSADEWMSKNPLQFTMGNQSILSQDTTIAFTGDHCGCTNNNNDDDVKSAGTGE